MSAAVAVGFVSFISPCVLPLVPGYLSAVSGVGVVELQRGERRLLKVLLPAIVFCLSFTVVFIALGMTATGLGSALQDSRGTLDKIAGGVIVAVGVLFLLTALAFTRAWGAFRWLRDRYVAITAISGFVLIVMGLLLLTGELTRLNTEAQQALDSLGLNIFSEL